MEIIVLGSGTSSGVPTIGCGCPTCQSSDPRDTRTRTSILIRDSESSVIVDTSIDFRAQCLRWGIDHLDGVVYTHHHFDHIAGFDDLRAFNFTSGRPVPIYAMEETLSQLQKTFDYAFRQASATLGSSAPKVAPSVIDEETFSVRSLEFTPLRLHHGRMRVNGYRIGNFAYCTDCSEIPAETLERLQGVRVLILDALRDRPHPTHFTLEGAVRMAEEIGAEQVYFTHMAHDLKHEETEARLPEGMNLAYDGLRITLPEST